MNKYNNYAHNNAEDSQAVTVRPLTPKNEFEYIRLKNGQWPGKLDIITNKLRY